MQRGPIYIVDDDIDDHYIIKQVWDELKLPNQLLFFSTAADMLHHLKLAERAPFLIICEVNLPKMDGFQLRESLLESGSKKFKSVPFIFWSSQASESQITEAYELSAHGFFIKGADLEQMKDSFRNIINYWSTSKMPSK